VKDAGKPFLFVVTQAKPNANITAQTIAALSRHGPVAQAFVADRVPYAMAMAGGNTASELAPKGPAAMEMTALWQEVKAYFAEISKPAKSERKVKHG
jgi:chromosome partitioning protein